MADLLQQLDDFARQDASAFDATRSRREGGFAPRGSSESAAPNVPPSKRLLSEAAYKAIIVFEISGEAAYTARYQHPIWPGGRSGVTIGVGYDLGFASIAEIQRDWGDVVPAAAITQLGSVLGKTGGNSTPDQMKALTASVNAVTIDFKSADRVFRGRSAPLYTALTENSLSNTDQLSADSLGALVSLVYNRGPSFSVVGDRYIEMRAIRDLMKAGQFAGIPDEFRKMARLWPDAPGLQKRRQLEAELFTRGLGA